MWQKLICLNQWEKDAYLLNAGTVSYLFGNGIGPLCHPIYKNKDKRIKCIIVAIPEDYICITQGLVRPS